MTTIIVTHEDHEVDEFEFESPHNSISIGRRSTNDVCIPNLSVSGNHARITIQGGKAQLEDLNSTNGTYVNGQIIKRQAIRNGDDIILGKIRLAFILPEAAAVTSEPAFADAGNLKVVADSVAANTELSNPENSQQQAQFEDHDISFAEDARIFAQPPVDTTRMSSANTVLTQGHVNQIEDHPVDGDISNSVVSTSSNSAPMHELDSPPATSKGAVIEIKNGAKSGQILPIDKPVTTLGRPGIQIAAIMRKPDGYFLMHIESDDSVDRPTLNKDAIGDEPVLLHSGDELNVAGIDVEFMLS